MIRSYPYRLFYKALRADWFPTHSMKETRVDNDHLRTAFQTSFESVNANSLHQ